VTLVAVRGDKGTDRLAGELAVHASQITAWKKQLVEQAAVFFEYDDRILRD